jgi:hypothetical protein
MAKAKTKKFTIVVRASVSENTVAKNVRDAIRREVAMAGEFNTRWIPAEPPMKLTASEWNATGGAIVAALKELHYPNLVVNRQEITKHHKKELTVFRAFLTKRITS